MNSSDLSGRRKFIKAGGIVIASSIVAGARNLFAKEDEKKKEDGPST